MSDPLVATLTVAPMAEDVSLTLILTVENTGREQQDLSFADGQRAEFVAVDDEGSEVWRWSDGRMFAMALGRETLAPDESVTYEAEWSSPPAGEYEVTGSLSATDADASATMTVVVPEQG
ncbi:MULTISPECIES: BsuPI-related putative proteinase inhibitor [Haloferax]|uniref:Intracellular proteinase inhibitor BsuPI domain-containing protein n=1 Tax=Haloferax marinum TaxID=2666143 RepID=A0A6A8G5Q7_9EURY|nr:MULTISPECIES: BsuPI-related putative proteinase inhibitor [Haloferax]KAB1196599.1 hypothetical protein Hfx1150_03320 [Haloferax sp. CBA1150]MRW95603.1 hypothetical protein [Haloferax marinum]